MVDIKDTDKIVAPSNKLAREMVTQIVELLQTVGYDVKMVRGAFRPTAEINVRRSKNVVVQYDISID